MAVFDAGLDAISVLFFWTEIFSMEKPPREHTFRCGFCSDFPRGNSADISSNSASKNSSVNLA